MRKTPESLREITECPAHGGRRPADYNGDGGGRLAHGEGRDSQGAGRRSGRSAGTPAIPCRRGVVLTVMVGMLLADAWLAAGQPNAPTEAPKVSASRPASADPKAVRRVLRLFTESRLTPAIVAVDA